MLYQWEICPKIWNKIEEVCISKIKRFIVSYRSCGYIPTRSHDLLFFLCLRIQVNEARSDNYRECHLAQNEVLLSRDLSKWTYYRRNYLRLKKKMKKQPKKLLDQVREIIRRKHYSIRTEEAYLSWIKRYILFHKKRHPLEMGKKG